MHATAISCVFLALVGQVGSEYGGKYADSDYGPPMSATSSPTRTRSTRATNPLKESYPPSRVATQPRYAAESSRESTLPPVGDSTRVAQEDPQSSLASKLLRDLLQSPVRGDENLRTLRLYDALEKATGSQQQFNAIKAYWEWSLAVSELHGVYEEDSILHDRKNTPRATHEQAAHVANQRASRSRLEDSRLDVAAKVVDLLETTGNRGASSAILPADVPFVSTYNTNFSRIFPGNSAPVTLAKIHKTLPSALSVAGPLPARHPARRCSPHRTRSSGNSVRTTTSSTRWRWSAARGGHSSIPYTTTTSPSRSMRSPSPDRVCGGRPSCRC